MMISHESDIRININPWHSSSFMNDLISLTQTFISSNGFTHLVLINYSGKFKPYNANVRKRSGTLIFSLAQEWEHVSNEIVLGLLQSLSCKVLNFRTETTNIDLYHNFIRSLHLSYPKDKTDPYLEGCFDRVNQKYFWALIETPNFGWHSSIRTLATYNYHTDTISVSDVFRGMDSLVDYLIYHEILHKKLKFKPGFKRSMHHGNEFRRLEKNFENSETLEKQISSVIRNQKFKY